jgi:hypothetical protein
MTLLALSVPGTFSSQVPAHVRGGLVPVLCLQPEEAGDQDQIDAATVRLLFRLAPFIEDRYYQQILDLNLPQLQGFTPVSSVCHLNVMNAIPPGHL